MKNPSAPAWLALVAIHVADVIIMSRGKTPITGVLQTKAGKVFTLLLVGHVASVWGRADPFHLLAKAADALVPRPRIP